MEPGSENDLDTSQQSRIRSVMQEERGIYEARMDNQLHPITLYSRDQYRAWLSETEMLRNYYENMLEASDKPRIQFATALNDSGIAEMPIEIWSKVLRYTDCPFPAILDMKRVSRGWYNMVNAYLSLEAAAWSRLDFRGYSSMRATPELLGVCLEKARGRAREIKLSFGPATEMAIMRAYILCQHEPSQSSSGTEHPEYVKYLVQRTEGTMAGVVRLQLDDAFGVVLADMHYLGAPTIALFAQLEQLRVPFMAIQPLVCLLRKHSTVVRFINLRELGFAGGGCSDSDSDSDWTISTTPPIIFPMLEVLEIAGSGTNAKVQLHYLTALVTRMPNLRTFRCHDAKILRARSELSMSGFNANTNLRECHYSKCIIETLPNLPRDCQSVKLCQCVFPYKAAATGLIDFGQHTSSDYHTNIWNLPRRQRDTSTHAVNMDIFTAVKAITIQCPLLKRLWITDNNDFGICELRNLNALSDLTYLDVSRTEVSFVNKTYSNVLSRWLSNMRHRGVQVETHAPPEGESGWWSYYDERR
ncbi:uncharacterized protein V1518DRAFT_409896 [Limtongia smithiae]|uniref:uncharacterized protein n=1 Tax=Limtongia smithiae TaxID=1125753 RepID=UPI0034CDD44D